MTYIFWLDVSPDLSQTSIEYLVDGRKIAPRTDRGDPPRLEVALGSPASTAAQARAVAYRALTQPGTPGVPRVTARALSVCGWRALAVELSPSTAPAEWRPDGIMIQTSIRGERSTVHVQGRTGMGRTGTISLVIDNRGEPSHELSIGQWKHTVASDVAEVVHAGVGDCDLDSWRSLVLDDVPIGSVPEPLKTVLVDPSGRRCYHFRGLNYFRTGEQGWSPWTYGLSRRKLHVIAEANGKIDHLFEKAPAFVRSAFGFEQRSELTERPCGGFEE